MIRCENNNKLESLKLDNLEGMIKESIIVKETIKFLLFDTSENALTALKQIKRINPDIYIKFGYYKIFFLINGLTTESDYSEVKKELISLTKMLRITCLTNNFFIGESANLHEKHDF